MATGGIPTFEISKDLIARRNQDGTVILMKMDESSLFYKIDGIAALLWFELQTKKTVQELIDLFSAKYPASRESIERDIPVFMSDLLQKHLVTEEKVASHVPATTLSSNPEIAQYYFGGIKEFNLEQIETEVLNESIYLDVFAGSDLRLKKNITPIRDGLNKIAQLEGVNFQWSDQTKRDSAMHAGVIAQEVATQMPELVRMDQNSGFLAIDYSKLTCYLIEAVKELNQMVLDQGERIRELEKDLKVHGPLN